MSDNEFEAKDNNADASLGQPVEANSMAKGSHIICKGRPCKIEDISKSKPGKHGSAKLNMKVTDIFTNKKYEMSMPSHDMVISPTVKRDEYQLVDVEGDYINLMMPNGDLREVKVNDNNLLDRIGELFSGETDVFVSVMSCNNEEMAVSARPIDTTKR
ncbi:hypothetical protein Ciccas_002399 [Cichlidogyrus casuarinus]|uniref:Eukaryotic translation initiation factor 5A n=1 Tax=Cichlidogyrus casuarinus TaxID=1844966 RepID=A0ABD2QHC1_9PLAT